MKYSLLTDLGDAVFAIMGKQGLDDCYIAPVGPESCKTLAFSCSKSFDVILSQTSN